MNDCLTTPQHKINQLLGVNHIRETNNNHPGLYIKVDDFCFVSSRIILHLKIIQ